MCLILFIKNHIVHQYLILIVFMLSVVFIFSTCYFKTLKKVSPYIKKTYIVSNFIEELVKISVDLFVICWIFKSFNLGNKALLSPLSWLYIFWSPWLFSSLIFVIISLYGLYLAFQFSRYYFNPNFNKA